MSLKKIVGRKKEVEILDRAWKSKDPEFIAIYGRRRVGKTHLIRQYFSGKGIYLEVSGAKSKPFKKQLENFMKEMSKVFFKGLPLRTPSNWDDAFDILTRELGSISKSKKVIIFLDELPWMVTKRSGLLQSLDYYWNLHWSKISNLILVVCGSAASWMLDKLIYAKGGLHNRITKKILLEPFTLKEAKKFLESRSIKLNQKQVLDIYMAIGGVPYYLKAINKGMSAVQNIEEMCFQKNGVLFNEFTNLYESLFEKAEIHLSIVREIAKHGNVLSRGELIKITGIKSGGTLNKRLKELESSGFIQTFLPYGRKKRDLFYRVIDEFSLFHLRWIEPLLTSFVGINEKGYWKNMVKTPVVSSWAGHAFEDICLKHLYQIRLALGLDKIACKTGTWSHIPKKGSSEDGVQIDLLFDREDGAITICEIKYSDKAFIIEKGYARKLIKKMNVFENQLKTTKQLFLAMITTMGIKHTVWAEELVENDVTLQDLFN